MAGATAIFAAQPAQPAKQQSAARRRSGDRRRPYLEAMVAAGQAAGRRSRLLCDREGCEGAGPSARRAAAAAARRGPIQSRSPGMRPSSRRRSRPEPQQARCRGADAGAAAAEEPAARHGETRPQRPVPVRVRREIQEVLPRRRSAEAPGADSRWGAVRQVWSSRPLRCRRIRHHGRTAAARCGGGHVPRSSSTTSSSWHARRSWRHRSCCGGMTVQQAEPSATGCGTDIGRRFANRSPGERPRALDPRGVGRRGQGGVDADRANPTKSSTTSRSWFRRPQRPVRRSRVRRTRTSRGSSTTQLDFGHFPGRALDRIQPAVACCSWSSRSGRTFCTAAASSVTSPIAVINGRISERTLSRLSDGCDAVAAAVPLGPRPLLRAGSRPTAQRLDPSCGVVRAATFS